MHINNIIYQFWTNNNHGLTKNRLIGINSSIENFKDCIVKLITTKNLKSYILEKYPLHPGYEYLSNIHKSDYLRSYFMNFYGGGYADIKIFSSNNNWKKCFEIINLNADLQIIGQKEIIGGSPIHNYNTIDIVNNKILCNGWFICRPHSEFTERWYITVQKIMDQHYSKLKNIKNIGDFTAFGENNYPIRWAELHGEILHKLEFEFSNLKPSTISNILKSGNTNKDYR